MAETVTSLFGRHTDFHQYDHERTGLPHGLFWCRDRLRQRIPRLSSAGIMTPEDLARVAPALPATGFRAIRERPILSTSVGLSAVLDAAIYGETLTIGPLFHLVTADKGRANGLFGHFARAFERYAIDILRRIYPIGSGLLAQLTNIEGHDAAGGRFEIDAAL